MLSMKGKTCVVTGSTSGIGLAMATELASRGAHVVMTGHEREPGERARARIGAATGSDALELHIADFSTLDAVRQLADALEARHAAIDVLMNNAGVLLQRPRTTSDGLDLTWSVNYFAPFLLTHLLLDRLEAAPQGRIINTASVAHRWGRLPSSPGARSRGWTVLDYFDTKLAIVMFTRALAARLSPSVTCNCFHPGVIGTDLAVGRGVIGRLMGLSQPLMKTPEQGARTGVFLATDEQIATTSGEYFVDDRVRATASRAHDAREAARLWARSVQVTDAPGARGGISTDFVA